jgi:predicted dehydrogenase
MIRIAFAGFRHGHILGLYDEAKKSPLVEIVGAFEADKATREKMERERGIAFTYDSYDALLSDKSVDAVAIGDYYSVRGSLAIRALKAGKHVIADKPLCTEQREAEEIAALAKETGLSVYLMLDLRFDPRFFTVKHLIEAGAIGRITQIRFGGQHPLLREERPGWYFEEGKHGGTINDIAIHGIDVIRYMCGLLPTRVLGARCWNAFTEDVPHFLDSGMYFCEMEGGAGLMADVSYASPNGMRYSFPYYWEFEIFGLGGVIRFGRNLPSIELYRKESDRAERIEPIPVEKTMIEDFADCVCGKKDTIITTADVLAATEWTLKIQKASEI